MIRHLLADKDGWRVQVSIRDTRKDRTVGDAQRIHTDHAGIGIDHDLRRERSLYYLLERKGAVERLFTDEEVDAAKTAPPPDTRARMRGEFIKLARENSIQYDLDWSNIRLGNLLNVRVICNNPFETDTEKVAELVRTIQKTNLRKTSLSKLVIQS